MDDKILFCTIATCENYSKSRTKTQERRQWHHLRVFIVNCEHISSYVLIVGLLSKWPAVHLILHIRISLATELQLKLSNLIFLDLVCPKKVFPVKIGKSEHLGTKYQLKRTILIFSTNLPKKCISGRKRKNCTCACVHGRYLLY